MFEEVKASALISSWLEGRGWTVNRAVYGIDTAFEARYSVKSGGRTVCYNAEYGTISDSRSTGMGLIKIRRSSRNWSRVRP